MAHRSENIPASETSGRPRKSRSRHPFLLAVEEAHCARNKAGGNDSFKLRTRNAVGESSEADFSGRLTPGNWKASE